MSNLKYLGYVLIAWGVLDFGMSYMGTDVWMDWLGVALPEAIWTYSGIIAIVLGSGAIKLSQSADVETEAAES